MHQDASTSGEVYDVDNDFLSPYGAVIIKSACHARSCASMYFIRKYPEVFGEVIIRGPASFLQGISQQELKGIHLMPSHFSQYHTRRGLPQSFEIRRHHTDAIQQNLL